MILRIPLRLPFADGLNVTLKVQLFPAAKELPQVVVSAKSPGSVPAMAIPLIVKAVAPRLVSVTVFAALVVPTVTEPKLRVAGSSCAVVPIPLSDTSCGLPLALSVTLRFAVRVPDTVGLKVRLNVQLAPAARELPQVVVSEKSPISAPVIPILVMLSEAVPTLVSVIFFKLLVPIATVP